MTEMVNVRVWRVYAWSKGRWTLRSTHVNPADAEEHAEYWRHKGLSSKAVSATARRPVPTPSRAPSAAQLHREAQADRMVVLRQATTYYKSPGSVLTALPKCPNLGHLTGGR